jgi:hypothetical protein
MAEGNAENAIIQYIESGQPVRGNNLKDLSGITEDLGSMANSIDTMGVSITALTDLAKSKMEELLEYIPPKEQLTPMLLIAGGLIGGYFLTGIIANVKTISASK